MAKIVENSKGFKTIEVGAMEMIEKITNGYPPICDFCNKDSKVGYLVSVINSWYCPKCYDNFVKNVKRYKEDIPYEEMRFNEYKEIFRL